MKLASNTKVILSATLALSVSVAFFFFTGRHPANHRFPASIAASVEGKDDPDERINFEWLKYHDPATGEIPRGIRAKELAVAERITAVELTQRRLGKLENIQRTLTTTWARRGPYNVGGRTRALAMDVSDTSIIVAGGVSGSMWKSTDGGQSWAAATNPDELHSATCVVQDNRTGKTNIWYQGTGELYGNSASTAYAPYRGDGLFKSTDNGATWFRLAATANFTPEVFIPPWDYVWNIAVDNSRTDSDIVYAATIGAVMRSNDGGTTWQIVKGSLTDPNTNPSGPFGPRLTDVIVTPSGVVYASLSWVDLQLDAGISAIDAGIWRSPDGMTWTNITPSSASGWPAGNYKRIVMSYAPSNANVIYILAETPGTNPTGHSLWKYTFFSGDGSGAGGEWENRSENLPNENGPTGVFDSQGSYDLVIAVKPDNEQVVFIGGTNLYRSTDGWSTSTQWKRIGGYASPGSYGQWPNHHCDQHVISFNPKNPSILLNGNDGGVYETYGDTSTSVQWASLNNGYLNAQFYSVALDHGSNGNPTIVGGTQDNGTILSNSTDPGSNWVDLLGGDGTSCAIVDGSVSYVLSSQQGNYYLVSLDEVNNFSSWTCITPKNGGPFLFVNPFALDPSDQNRMYLPAGDVLWRNNDLSGIPLYSSSTTSVNWDSLSGTRINGITYTAVAVARVPANRVYLGSSDGRVFRLENANSDSPTLNDVYSGKGLPTQAYVNCIAIDPTNGDKAMIVFTNYGVQSLFYTEDAGKSWSPVGGNLEENPTTGSGGGPSTRWAAILPPGGRTTYFVGTSTGLYSTTNLNGTSTVWSLEGSSTIGNLPIDMIDIRPSDGYIAVATHGGGVFTASISFQVSVYPGDANNDGVVDVQDILPIGRFYGLSGPARLGASTTWGAQSLASAWNPLDAGFADCDGNGIVDSNDVVALVQNWRATRGQGVPSSVDYVAAAEEILQALDAQSSSAVANSLKNAVNAFAHRGIDIPSMFSLEQNYPNPFNPSTSFQFTLPKGTTSATLTIFDITGRIIWQNHMNDLASGLHTTSWGGKTMEGIAASSGVYLYRLAAGGRSAVKRMLLLR
jgi:photosystem II stability/assembly factor-like uncharacterized protein